MAAPATSTVKRAIAFAFLAQFCAGDLHGRGSDATASKSLEATVAELAISHPREGRQLAVDLDALKERVKAKAQEHADSIRQNAPGVLADVQTSWSQVSESAAAKASEALENSMDSTMDMAFSFLKLSDEVSGCLPCCTTRFAGASCCASHAPWKLSLRWLSRSWPSFSTSSSAWSCCSARGNCLPTSCA